MTDDEKAHGSTFRAGPATETEKDIENSTHPGITAPLTSCKL
jgi:hypothetical protein